MIEYGKTDTNTTSSVAGTVDSLTSIDSVFNTVKKKEDVKVLAKELNKSKGFVAAKIEGGYRRYIIMMINQHLSSGRQLVGNIICIDSFDGTLHSATNTKDNGIVSFNSQLYHRDFSLHGISTASSKNILTWMNSLTDETVATIFPIIIPIFEEQLQQH